MKTLAVTSLLLFSASWAQAQEVGQVISRTAVYQQVAVPRQTCTQIQTQVPAQTSGGGAIIGAITGGLIGSQFGGRNNQGMAAMAGVIGGAMLGDRVESQGYTTAPQTTCSTLTVYENRLTGYNVVYEYAGKQYNVQLPQDPGPTIQLQVTPMGAPQTQVQMETTLIPAQPAATVINKTRVVYVPAPVYSYYPPVHTQINWGWSHRVGSPYVRQNGRHHGHYR